MEFAKIIAQSSLCPEQYRGKPADVLIAVQLGAELGVAPLQALSGIAVVNGRASVWGDLGRAVVLRSGLLEDQRETYDDATKTARCELKRRGVAEPFVGTFSWTDATAAKLTGKQTYQQYGKDMLAWRAWWRAARKGFADALKGVAAAEEQTDYVDAQPAPIAMPRRASETTAGASVAAFLGGGETAVAAPEPEQPPADGGDSWRGVIAESGERSGESAKGRKWTLHTFTGEDGTSFGTFSGTVAAQVAEVMGHEVVIGYETTDKGSRNILSVALAG